MYQYYDPTIKYDSIVTECIQYSKMGTRIIVSKRNFTNNYRDLKEGIGIFVTKLNQSLKSHSVPSSHPIYRYLHVRCWNASGELDYDYIRRNIYDTIDIDRILSWMNKTPFDDEFENAEMLLISMQNILTEMQQINERSEPIRNDLIGIMKGE